MFNPSKDLTEVQRILINDSKILELMGLTNATLLEKGKRIIKGTKFNDLATNEIRLCIFFNPSRKTRNECVQEETVQIDCHVPYSMRHKAYDIQERVFELLQRKTINNKYFKFYSSSDLSTADGFFCVGSRYQFYRNV